MVLIRVIYPVMDGWKLMRLYEVPAGQRLAAPPSCSQMMAADWESSVAGMGGIEQDYIDTLGITEVQDMRE